MIEKSVQYCQEHEDNQRGAIQTSLQHFISTQKSKKGKKTPHRKTKKSTKYFRDQKKTNFSHRNRERGS